MLILTLLIPLAAVSVSADYGTFEIPFDEEIYVIQENLTNSAEELNFTVLYASDPNVLTNANAAVCEFDQREIEEKIRTYEEKLSQSAMGGVNAEDEPEDLLITDCDAVRIAYRFAPSPIPADAKLIRAEFDFGAYDLEFILSKAVDPSFPSVTRFVQYLPSEKIRFAFFGEEGAKIYDETDKTFDSFARTLGTRDQFHIYSTDFLSARHHFELDLRFDQQYVHQDVTPFDWTSVGDDRTIESVASGFSSLIDGEFGMGGGGGNSPSESEAFEGPINTAVMSLAENHRLLDSGLTLNRIAFLFNYYPRLKFSYTTDGTYIQSWETGLKTFTKWVVNYPGMEKIENLPDPSDWLHYLINR